MRDVSGIARYSKFEKSNFRHEMQCMKKTIIARFTLQHAGVAPGWQFMPATHHSMGSAKRCSASILQLSGAPVN
jgi:hypothetical protein